MPQIAPAGPPSPEPPKSSINLDAIPDLDKLDPYTMMNLNNQLMQELG